MGGPKGIFIRAITTIYSDKLYRIPRFTAFMNFINKMKAKIGKTFLSISFSFALYAFNAGFFATSLGEPTLRLASFQDKLEEERYSSKTCLIFRQSRGSIFLQKYLVLSLQISDPLYMKKSMNPVSQVDLISCGQSYKASTIINYDSRVVPDWKIPHITTLES